MSLGRRPAYIYDCACAGETERHPPTARHFAINVARYLTYDELAQLLVHLTAVELGELVDRGLQLQAEIRQTGNSDPARARSGSDGEPSS